MAKPNDMLNLGELEKFAARAGKSALRRALELWYATAESATPIKVKVVIAGALSYLVMPVDAIPDFIPFMGFTDDLTALGVAASVAAAYITPAVRERAERTLRKWVG